MDILWLDLNVWINDGAFEGDPIDELQKQYSQFISDSSLLEVKAFLSTITGLLIAKLELQNTYKVYLNNQIKTNLGDFKKSIYILETFD